MYYGIDLGTTNSLIGSGENLYTGLVSSSVNVKTKQQSARDIVSGDIVSSYKVNMTIGEEGKLSIACSAIILRDLAEKASMAAKDNVTDIVVSVPAKFSHTQRQAVWEAAKIAGLNMKGLINEPTAAAIYVCRDMKDLVIVYDLGGGTFDVTLVDSRAGSYYVVASEGEILAGDNFDEALALRAFDDCKVKLRFRGKDNLKRLKAAVRLAKESIQRTGLVQYVDMTPYGYNGMWQLTEAIYVPIMKEVFARTISLTRHILQANLDETESPRIVFAGGSTACPYLREWVCKETKLQAVECHEPPDYIVAKGVALYAEMLFNGTAVREVDDVTKRLSIEDNRGMSITVIEKNTTIPITETMTVSNSIRSDKLEIRLYQGDSITAASNDYIGTLVYNYDKVMEPEEGFVDISVTVDRDGRISLMGTDVLTMQSQKIDLILK